MKRVRVLMGRTINTGNFENKRIELCIEKEIKDDADEVGAMDEIMNTLDEILDEEEAVILKEATEK